MPVATSYDRSSRTAVVAVRGDVTIASARPLYDQLRALGKRRDVSKVVVDFANAGRLDSSALAAVSLGLRGMRRSTAVALEHLDDRHRRALALVPPGGKVTAAHAPVSLHPGIAERVGASLVNAHAGARAFGSLVYDLFIQAWRVATRRTKLPQGAVIAQMSRMGVDGIPIVALLACLLGCTLGFQGIVLLHRFGAGLFVADLIGISMVRELAPMMTAIVLTGRTGAAIAAELGTMRVRGEIDAFQAMGVSPVRYLILPRMIALTAVQPALVIMATFVGIGGGMLVASAFMHLPPSVFWSRLVERVELADWIHGVGKSVVFAWIIGLTGSHLGMRADADASSVGSATTRTVVIGVFAIILVDALAATISSFGQVN